MVTYPKLRFLLLASVNPQIYLGDFPAERFKEAKAQNLIARFRRALDEIDGQIKERNAQLDVPYLYLLPSRIPNSITI